MKEINIDLITRFKGKIITMISSLYGTLNMGLKR